MKTRVHFTLICSLLIAFQALAGDKVSFLKKQFTTSDGYQLNYRVLYPLNYSPGQKYPLVLFLHGSGERGNDNEKQLVHGGDLLSSYETQSNYPAIIIVPQCPEEQSWLNYERNHASGTRHYPANAPVAKPLAAVKELVDSYVAKGIVDAKQMHIMGLSMGGMGTFDLVMRYPDLFVTATPICGGVSLERAARYKVKTRFRLFHGADDSVVPAQFSRDACEALQQAGVTVTYKEYPAVEHDSWHNAFAEPDYMSWMLEKSF
ncbi:MAG: dienelactone hydrolase family protein [Tannerellaceae bacterium]|nr:dienelactone hydrolase family protein [Tannerellaceae bacterium]